MSHKTIYYYNYFYRKPMCTPFSIYNPSISDISYVGGGGLLKCSVEILHTLFALFLHMALILFFIILHSILSLSLSFSQQNDDPFPSHIVNVFSFAHLPFSLRTAIKYIFLSIYTLQFSKSYFLQRSGGLKGVGCWWSMLDGWLVCGVWWHEGSKMKIFRPFLLQNWKLFWI